MTRERIAIYLCTMARMSCEPYTVIEFHMKYNTEKRREKADDLIDRFERVLDKYQIRKYYYISTGYRPASWENPAEYWDFVKVTIKFGDWTDKNYKNELLNYLKRYKIEYSLTEWR